MEEVQENPQDKKLKKSCLESECLEYIEKIYNPSSSQCYIKANCAIVKDELKELNRELIDRRCLLEQEIIGNCTIAEKLASIENPASADRIYKLSATDLFVEKAIHLLDDEAQKHEKSGKRSFFVTIAIIAIGTLIALAQMIGGMEYLQKELLIKEDVNQTREIQLLIQQSIQYDTFLKKANKTSEEHNISKINETVVKTIVGAQVDLAWKDALMTFTKSFTFYGLLVLAAVFLKRQGKASLDQAERIKDKRHALREGRLYIHLKNGQIQTVEELEKAFNWNSSQQNAFSEINTEAQAPWGTVFKGITETFTKTVESIMKNKNSGEQK